MSEQTTQKRIDNLNEQLRQTTQASICLSMQMPAHLAGLNDDELAICRSAVLTISEVWRTRAAGNQFWRTLSGIIEREQTRRGLTAELQVGELTRLAEL